MIPTQSSLNLGSMKFDDFSLESDEMLRASVRMFLDCGLIDEFNIDYQVLFYLFIYLTVHWLCVLV